MPTLQLKLSDDEVTELLFQGGHATATKSALFIIKDYPMLMNQLSEQEAEIQSSYARIKELEYLIEHHIESMQLLSGYVSKTKN